MNAAFVEKVTRPGRYGDGRGGHGLSLLVKPASGKRLSKTWHQRLRLRGRVFNMGLGPYPKVTLEEARKKALQFAQATAQGLDPRGPAEVPTFAEAAAEVIALHRPNWKEGGSTEEQWRSTLKKHVFPTLGDKLVTEIRFGDVLSVLEPLWGSRHKTALAVRRRIRMVLGWCQAFEHLEENVADDRVDAVLPPAPSRRTHHRALPFDDVPRALDAAEACRARPAVRLCFRFLVLTAARSKEARGARWSEIRVDEGKWIIPGDRMKGGEEHEQPLSTPALDLLRAAKTLDDGSGLVFPSPTGSGKPMDATTLTDLLERIGIRDNATIHGFRSTFRDWAAERTEAERAVMELSLAHVTGSKVQRAYFRSPLWEKRIVLMEQWAAFACGLNERGRESRASRLRFGVPNEAG